MSPTCRGHVACRRHDTNIWVDIRNVMTNSSVRHAVCVETRTSHLVAQRYYVRYHKRHFVPTPRIHLDFEKRDLTPTTLSDMRFGRRGTALQRVASLHRYSYLCRNELVQLSSLLLVSDKTDTRDANGFDFENIDSIVL